MRSAALALRVLRWILAHPSNQGRRGRQLAQAIRFQMRGRVLHRPTIVRVGRRSRLIAHLHERGSSLVVYANPHDHDELLLWEKVLGPGDVFVDVGANVGSYSLWAAERGAEVIAFEPDANARRRLAENARLNGYAIDLRPQVVSSAVGTVHMTSDRDTMNHMVLDGAPGGHEATTLDEALGDVPRVRGLKIDVEGFERLVLEGAARLLAKGRIDLIQAEWNDLAQARTGEGREGIARLLEDHGYHLFRPSGQAGFDEPGADVFAVSARCREELLRLGVASPPVSPDVRRAPVRSAQARAARGHPDGLRLNLGSGPEAVDGWVNLDRSPSLVLDRIPLLKKALRAAGVLEAGHMASWSRDVEMLDLRKPLPYPDGSVGAIYSSHTLEHLYPDEAQRVLEECFRVQASDGILRLALPDAEAFARDLVSAPTAEAARQYNERLNVGTDAPPPRIRRLLRPFQGSYHKWQPTPALVREMLERAGYPSITQQAFRTGDLPGLDEIEHREESFFLEARKVGPQ